MTARAPATRWLPFWASSTSASSPSSRMSSTRPCRAAPNCKRRYTLHRTHMHAHTHTHLHAHTHSSTCTAMQPLHSSTCTAIHTLTLIYMHSYSQTHTHLHAPISLICSTPSFFACLSSPASSSSVATSCTFSSPRFPSRLISPTGAVLPLSTDPTAPPNVREEQEKLHYLYQIVTLNRTRMN